MEPCPACAAPLPPDGLCPACGALSRGMFGGVDIATPQIADAVERGFDFYRLLGASPDDDQPTLARRYRRLRTLFPDTAARLEPRAARKLALLETAGRVLTHPQHRAAYDTLRTRHAPQLETAVRRCSGCGAPLGEGNTCRYCATAAPARAEAPAAPPATPAADPTDYYAVLGLDAHHLLAHDDGDMLSRTPPPDTADIDALALRQQEATLLDRFMGTEQRERRLHELALARAMLRDERRRTAYDILLLGFRGGLLTAHRLEALHRLEEDARAEATEAEGGPLHSDPAALLEQARGYLAADLPREALPLLERAVQIDGDDRQIQQHYLHALLTAGDPLDLTPHELRRLRTAAELLAHDDHSPAAQAHLALARGLMARDAGAPDIAAAELQRAALSDPTLLAAWRGQAALALARSDFAACIATAQRALALCPTDERALMMLTAAAVRSNQRTLAEQTAHILASQRGTTAPAIISELSGM